MYDKLEPELKDAVVARLAGLDRDRLLDMIERLQETVINQAVQLSELQAENAKQAIELNGLGISLEEALTRLSKVKDTYISRDQIAEFVINSINDGRVPIPKNIDRNVPLSISCDPDKIRFGVGSGFRVPVDFLFGDRSGHNIIFCLSISPDDRIKEVYYPDFHMGYTNPSTAKRVRKPKAKPTAEKKAG